MEESMKFNASLTVKDKISAIVGTVFVIIGAGMLFVAGASSFTLLPLTFGGIGLVLGGIYLARSHRLIELINDLLR
jgi:uncharacterized membrane protein